MMAPQINSKKDLFYLYFIASLFSGGRLFVGAISVLYVLSHGIGVAEFATIKSIQVVTFIIFDIPAGFFIKRFGHKTSLITTFTLSILGLLLYVTGNSLYHFIIAEFIIALSLCLFPTAFTQYTMNFLRKYPSILIEKVFHRSDMYASIATLICGGLGGYLFSLDKTLPYFAGIFVQMLGFFLILKIDQPILESREKSDESALDSLKNVFPIISSLNFTLLTPILLLFVIQLTIQPLYHYWQPLFYEIDDSISGNMLGFIFASYSICSIFLNLAFSKLSNNSFFRSINCIFMILLTATIFYFTSALSKSITLTFISFSILQGLLFTSLTCISAIINRYIEDENRPIVLKMISLLSRIGMLISFGLIQILYSLKVHDLYLLSAGLLCVSIVAIKLTEIRLSNSKSKIGVKIENFI